MEQLKMSNRRLSGMLKYGLMNLIFTSHRLSLLHMYVGSTGPFVGLPVWRWQAPTRGGYSSAQ
jgi:hypothetical protein